MAFSSAIAPAAPTGAAAQSQATIAQDFDTFLTILTTQLQSQDPLDPMESSEFTNQLVAFAEVEQAIQQNQNLEDIHAALVGNQVATAIDYLGQDVTIAANSARLDADEAGIAFSYALPAGARDVVLEVLDSRGAVVRETRGRIEAGTHDFFFNGLDDDGDAVPPGTYALRVSARGAEDRALATEVRVSDRVTAIDTTRGQPTLTVGGRQVTLNDILGVRAPASQS